MRKGTMRLGVWLALVGIVLAPDFLRQQPLAVQAATGFAWLQFGGDPQHSGNNTQETQLSATTVSGLHQEFKVSLSPGDVADGAPVYLSGVTTVNGTQDLVFVTTKSGYIEARDAHTGALVWSHQNGPGTCRINNGGTVCYTTSSPAIDPNLQYVYSYGLDGYVHKYAVGSGVENTGGGWPELATYKPFDEKGSSALSVVTIPSGAYAGSYLYVVNAGYPGDAGDYQGHVTAINLGTGAQHVFNTLCSNQLDVHFHDKSQTASPTPDCNNGNTTTSAIWGRPGTIYDPVTGYLLVTTGNGAYSPASYDWGDSVLAIHPDGTANGSVAGYPIDSFTPSDYQYLQNTDTDLGSTEPALLPPVVHNNQTYYLAVQAGKGPGCSGCGGTAIWLLNRTNLSLKGGPGNLGTSVPYVNLPQGGEVLPQPAVWTNPQDGSVWVFISSYNGISGMRLSFDASGNPTLVTGWTFSDGSDTSPLIANNVLFVAHTGLIEALNPATGSTLWSDSTIGGIHWESPMVADGSLYITDNSGNLTAYGLPATTQLSVSAPSSATAGTSFSVTVTAKDASGNTTPAYRGTVHVTSSDGQAVLPANYTFTAADAGSHVFTVTLKTAGSQSVTVTETATPSVTGSSLISVGPGPAATFTTTAPSSVTAGSPFTLTAKVKDAYGNQVTGYTGTVHFTSTDAQAVLPANYTFVGADSGTHSFSVTLKTAGWQTVTVADAGNGSVAGTSGPIMVSPTSTTKLVLDAPSNVTTGTPFAVRVRAEDQYGNTTPAYTGTVSWTSGDGQAVLPATYTFTGTDQGSHIFSVTLKTGGTQSITVTDTGNGGISGTASVVVNSTVTVSYSAAAGWNLVGGSPLTVWSGPEFQAAWSWNALSGQWTSLTSASPPQPQGSGAWEEVSGSSTETVTAQVCSAPVSVVVMPHRWNMVGNPCNTVVQLPAGTHAVSWNGTGYDLTSSIGIGAAAWVVPASGALTLSP